MERAVRGQAWGRSTGAFSRREGRTNKGERGVIGDEDATKPGIAGRDLSRSRGAGGSSASGGFTSPRKGLGH